MRSRYFQAHCVRRTGRRRAGVRRADDGIVWIADRGGDAKEGVARIADGVGGVASESIVQIAGRPVDVANGGAGASMVSAIGLARLVTGAVCGPAAPSRVARIASVSS